MSDREYLHFNYEAVDDGRLVTAQYGTVWLTWLLGVAKQLTNADLWSPESDRDAAVQYANELVVRLMGSDDLVAQEMYGFPLWVSAYSWQPASGKVATFQHRDETHLTPTSILSDDVDESAEWVYRDMFFVAGNYKSYFAFNKNSMRAKVMLTISGGATVPGSEFDCYSATPVLGEYKQWNFTIPSDGVYRVALEKRGNNPASSGATLVLYGTIFREN